MRNCMEPNLAHNLFGSVRDYPVDDAITIIRHEDVTPIVFVVDDDISVRESLELLIRSAGWESETFASAEEFLSHPHVVLPCCLIVDLTLPGVSGLDLQKQLTGRLDMPIIFVSGHTD